jgi:glutaredoxin
MEFTKPYNSGFTVYSKSGCPNCIIVKKYIKEKNFLLQEINCDEYILEDKENFLKFIETITGYNHKIFPLVFYEGKIIGGLNETKLFIEKLLSFEDIFNIF